MLTNLDMNRLNFVLPLGRRFSIAAMLIFKYINILGVVNGLSPLNGTYDQQYSLNLTYSDTIDTFDCFSHISDPNEENKSTEIIQLFSAFDGEMYINYYKEINHYQFSRAYRDVYSKTVCNYYYAICKSIIPFELNICSFDVKCDYGPDKVLHRERYPLIDAMYRSNEVVNFCNKIICGLMFSTHMHFDIYGRYFNRCLDFENEFELDFSNLSKTWNSKILNFRKCFSL